MAKENEIKIIVEAEVKRAIDGLKKFGDGAEKATKKSKKGFDVLQNKIRAIGATLGAAIIARGLAKIIKSAADFQQLNIAFATFLGSAEKAKKVISDLEKFSIVTPFTMNQVTGAAKTLLAFGIEAEDLQETLKLLGDVSAGTGKDLKEMAVIFGQIKGAGRLMGQDLLQLINAGFNPLQVISEKTGRSMRDLKDDMGKGLISFEQVKGAFQTATSEGGLFFDLMDKQSKSFSGRLSTLQGSLQIVARNIGENLLPAAGAFVEFINDMATAGSKESIQLAKTNTVLNDRFEILKRSNIDEATREKILKEVNSHLVSLDIAQVDATSSLEDLNAAQKKSNDLFLERIRVAAKQELIAEKEKEAANVQKEIIEDEIRFQEKRRLFGKSRVADVKKAFKIEAHAIRAGIKAKKERLIVINEEISKIISVSDIKRKEVEDFADAEEKKTRKLKSEIDKRKKAEEAWPGTLKEAQRQALLNFNQAAGEIIASGYDRRVQGIEEEKQLIQDQVEAKIITEEEGAKRKKEIDKKIAAEKRKQAISDKIFALSQIAMQTAIGISKVWAEWGWLSRTKAAIMSGFIGATGLAQAAVVASQPIPAFAMGTDSAPGGRSLVGESGPEEVDLPAGARVTANHEMLARASSTVNNTENIDNKTISMVIQPTNYEDFIRQAKQRLGKDAFT